MMMTCHSNTYYNVAEIEQMLKTMEILIDTREQDTNLFKRRVGAFTCPFTRYKLNYGDYSAQFKDVDGKIKTLENIAVIERKMSLDEIANNFTAERKRFVREFERAKGCHIHLIIENGSFEDMYVHRYRSKLNSKAFIASLLTFSIRYGIQIHFCKPDTTGKLICEIMHYELREYLLSLEV